MRPSKKTCAIGLALAALLLAAGICWSYRVELFILPGEWARVQEMRAEIEARGGEATVEEDEIERAGMERIFAMNGEPPPRWETWFWSFWSTGDADMTGGIVSDRPRGYQSNSYLFLVSSSGQLAPHKLLLPHPWTVEASKLQGRPSVFWAETFAFECAKDGIVPLGFFSGTQEGNVAASARTDPLAMEWRVWSSKRSNEKVVPKADASSSRNHALRYLHQANVVDDPIADIEALLQHSDRFVRARAIATLSEAREMPPFLVRFLDSDDDLVRGCAQLALLDSADSRVRLRAACGSVRDRRLFRWEFFNITPDEQLAELTMDWIAADPEVAFRAIGDRLAAEHTRRHLLRLTEVYQKLDPGSEACRLLSRALCRTGDRAAIDIVWQNASVDSWDREGTLPILLGLDPLTNVPANWINRIRQYAHERTSLRSESASALLIHWNVPGAESLYPDFSVNFFEVWARSPIVVDFLVSLALENPKRTCPMTVLATSPSLARKHKESVRTIWLDLRSRGLWMSNFLDLIEKAKDPELDALLISEIENGPPSKLGHMILRTINEWDRTLPIDEQALRRWMAQVDERNSETIRLALPYDWNPIELDDEIEIKTLADTEFFTAASAEAALLFLRSKPEFLDEFLDHVARPDNKWLFSPNLIKALSPQALARLRGITWSTEDQRFAWKVISYLLTSKPRKFEDLSLWEQYERRWNEFEYGISR